MNLSDQIIPLALEEAYISSLMAKQAEITIRDLSAQVQQKQASQKETVSPELIKRAAQAIATYRQLPAHFVPEIEKSLEKHAQAIELIEKLADPGNQVSNSPFAGTGSASKGKTQEKKAFVAIDSRERLEHLGSGSSLARKILGQLKK